MKAHAGILETDDAEQAEEKLQRALGDSPGDERFAERLRPLVGLPAAHAADEVNFAAWRLFLESLADSAPAVVVFEDLHWADDGTVAFLVDLIEGCAEHPLVIVGTARPEFLRVHPEVQEGRLPVRLVQVHALDEGRARNLWGI